MESLFTTTSAVPDNIVGNSLDLQFECLKAKHVTDIYKKAAVDICSKQALFTEVERYQFNSKAFLIVLRSGTHCIGIYGCSKEPDTSLPNYQF